MPGQRQYKSVASAGAKRVLGLRKAHLPALELAAVAVVNGVHGAVAAPINAVSGALGALGVIGALPDHEVGREQRKLVLQPHCQA